MAIPDDYPSYDAVGLADLVRRGEATPAGLLESALDRLSAWNPALNAVINVLEEDARTVIRTGLGDGPFRGVPFLLKDLGVLHTGAVTSNGSGLFADYVPRYDSEIVTRYKRAGLVVIGKTNTPELGFSATTEPRLWGPCRNPWDLSRSPGGASGGTAAAVAAGIVPAAHGSDGGGSIRIPASCCGLFGLKPTRARNPAGPDLGESLSGMGQNHVISRSVRDSAALLDMTAGPDLGAPYIAPVPARPFQAEVGADPGRLHIAVSDEAPAGVTIDPVCQAALADAADLCRELGHHVENADLGIDSERLFQALLVIWAANIRANVQARELALGRTATAADLEPIVAEVAQRGDRATATDYVVAVQAMHRTGRRAAGFFEAYDVLMTPTLAQPPPPLGQVSMATRDLDRYIDDLIAVTPFTFLFNVTGQPAMSVPLYWNAQGLPIGVQFAGRYGDEACLLRLAAQLEAARPWAHRRPTLPGERGAAAAP